MKIRLLPVWFLLSMGAGSCIKNNTSKIPHISLVAFPTSPIKVTDTPYIYFHLVDGDADLGNDPNSTKYDIFLKDSRYDSSGFTGFHFPPISSQAENPNKGVTGNCLFLIYNGIPFNLIRNDSLHMATGDTMAYELYIVDRAGNESNHIVTPKLVVKPH